MDYSKNRENSIISKEFYNDKFWYSFLFFCEVLWCGEWILNKGKFNLFDLIWFVNILKKMKNSTTIYLLGEYDSDII